ncbi:MAG: phosphoribosylanthranilate isomerase [Firmicutes bacterium]|nr:phosphoribosylanthranilate isomerase [Bacillota bacterium]
MVRVKICGISTIEEALAAVDAGAHALGFVFAASPRQVTPVIVRRIVRELPPLISKVGVFVNAGQETVAEIADYCHLDVLQFHGEETPEDCQGWRQPVIKAFRVKDRSFLKELPKYRVAAYLLDAFVPGKMGGTGTSFNWELAREAKRHGPIILAGGIKRENVVQALRVVEPFAIDVSSGVETGGRKDPQKIMSLMAEVRRVNDELTRR